jgi:hypothetical protein
MVGGVRDRDVRIARRGKRQLLTRRTAEAPRTGRAEREGLANRAILSRAERSSRTDWS